MGMIIEPNPCRKGNVSGCRMLDIQRRVLNSGGRATTRLTGGANGNIASFETDTAAHRIKGFYAGGQCLDSNGIVVFHQVQGSRMRAPHHENIAPMLELGVERDYNDIGESGPRAVGLVDRGIWGIILERIDYKLNPRESLSDEDIEDQHRRRVYGYFFDSTVNSPNDFWQIVAFSGLAGEIPGEVIPKFLDTLARCLTPSFSLFALPPRLQNGNLVTGLVKVPLDGVFQPSCLRWPEDQMLVQQLKQRGINVEEAYKAGKYTFSV